MTQTIYNDSETITSQPYHNTTWIGMSYPKPLHPDYPDEFYIYRYTINNPSNGWQEVVNAFKYNHNYNNLNFPEEDCKTLTNVFYINFSSLNSVISLSNNSLNAINSCSAGTAISKFVDSSSVYSLYQGVNIDKTASHGIDLTGDSEEGYPIVPMEILDEGADVIIDPSKAPEINDAYENGATSGTADTYTDVLPDIVDGLSDLLFRTSTIYKLLFSWTSGITAIPTILTSILTGVNGLVTGIGQQIGQWVIDGETGDNYLSHLIPIDNIAAGVADIPGYFIDEDTDEPFLGQTVTAVNTVIDNLGVEEGSESIAGLLGRIATGIDTLAGDEAVAEDEEAEDAPVATMASAIDIAVTNNGGRPTSDVSKIMMLPLMFIFILLMILFLLLNDEF